MQTEVTAPPASVSAVATEESFEGRGRAPSKAQCDLLSMESELATLNTTFSQLNIVALQPSPQLKTQQTVESGDKYSDLQDLFCSPPSEPPQPDAAANLGTVGWGTFDQAHQNQSQQPTTVGQGFSQGYGNFGQLAAQPQTTPFSQQPNMQCLQNPMASGQSTFLGQQSGLFGQQPVSSAPHPGLFGQQPVSQTTQPEVFGQQPLSSAPQPGLFGQPSTSQIVFGQQPAAYGMSPFGQEVGMYFVLLQNFV